MIEEMKGSAERVDITPILDRHPPREGQVGLMPVLQEIQEEHGYLPVDALERVSGHLGVPLAHIHGVVSFYAQFSLVPRGRHVIRMCMGTACHIRGGGAVLDEIRTFLGIGNRQTTPDRLFTLEVVRCLGTCFLAPVIMIDEKYFGALTRTKVRKILAAYQNGGTAGGDG
jgi:NADH-quinone oxidoreductase subunit E